MNIRINSDVELKAFGILFRGLVSLNPVNPEDHEYAKTEEEFRRKVTEMAFQSKKDGYNHLLKLSYHNDTIISVALSLDQDEKVSNYHLSCVAFDVPKKSYLIVPDELAHKLAHHIVGEDFWEIPHPGTMIQQIRHFLAKSK